MRKSRVSPLNKLKILIVFSGLGLFLGSCGTSSNKLHPSLQNITETTGTSSVYFIRPQPVKTKPIADKPITIDFKKQELLTIKEGNYTLLKIHPGQGIVTTHSLTKFTAQPQPMAVSRSRKYTFLAGRTYFILLKQLNEEFRGVFYDPAPISLYEAKVLVETLRANGLARSARIEDIVSVPDAPAQGDLKPALPENLYPQSPYLLKKPKIE